MRHFVVSLLLVAAPLPASAQDLPSCGDATVNYSPPSGIIPSDQFVLEKAPAPNRRAHHEPQDQEVASPQGDAAYSFVLRPDTSKAGPHKSVVLIYRKRPRASTIAWRLTVRDSHDNVGLEWLNDELLLIRVWWGRIMSTDAILHVPSGQYLYMKEAHYGDLTEPCK